MSMDDLIDKLLESLWLQDRLSHNTLQSYRRDLVKVAARLAEGGQDWLSADELDLAGNDDHFQLLLRALEDFQGTSSYLNLSEK